MLGVNMDSPPGAELVALQAVFSIPEDKITPNGGLLPPRPPNFQIEYASTTVHLFRPFQETTIPCRILGLYNLVIRLENGLLFVKLVSSKDVHLPTQGTSNLDPFASPDRYPLVWEWRLPANNITGRRVHAFLNPSTMKRKQGYFYRKAFALAHSGLPIDPAKCSGAVGQSTTFKLECLETTVSFTIHAFHESLHANPFHSFNLELE